jgi:diketogulonate reductase-like aldo/keto reductase
MRKVTMPSGNTMPAFGMGTWHMGERRRDRNAEVEALRFGLDLGIGLIDTAEMYGEGGAEEVIGEVLVGRRDEAYIVSKVYPHNATRKGIVEACERSLSRMKTDHIDLYLLHWTGSVPLSETFAGFNALRDSGKIRDFGVSNFDLGDLEKIGVSDRELLGSNQVLYNLAHREGEWAVLPWCRQHGVPVMAYCPLDPHGGLLQSSAVMGIADRHNSTPAQVALAWLLQQEGVVVIPKSSQPERIKENFEALQLRLDEDDLETLDRTYPPPDHSVRLTMS